MLSLSQIKLRIVAAIFPAWFLIDPLVQTWLVEDVGRGDRTTQAIFPSGDLKSQSQATWIAKQAGVVTGLPIAQRVFQKLDPTGMTAEHPSEGSAVSPGDILFCFTGSTAALLMGERVALNVVMHLSGIATMTRQYVEAIADLKTQLVDTRKTTPGLRILEKYATQVGGARNHRLGLDDAVMIKDNHIQASGSITAAVERVRQSAPYPLSIEVETSTLAEVEEALHCGIEIIMLDNMSLEELEAAVELIRTQNSQLKIEASGNITLDTIRAVAQTGVDFISSSAPITRSPWLDISMQLGRVIN
ncbi:MAG: carboxylating nicotinate-nucleotide diphosphorylase [Cyanobacteria bacterium P01_G01_bin.54]